MKRRAVVLVVLALGLLVVGAGHAKVRSLVLKPGDGVRVVCNGGLIMVEADLYNQAEIIAWCNPDTPSPIDPPTPTPVPPTNTPAPPTATDTPAPPTDTPAPPTATNTPAPPTLTHTPAPPTNTPVPGSGGTWYVDATVAGSGRGTTWATAFKTIQEGIDAATDGDTVLVAEETYVENIDFEGKNIVLQSADRSAGGAVLSYTIEVDITPLSGEETRVLYARAYHSDNYRVDFSLDGFRLTIPAWLQHWSTRYFNGDLSLSHGQTYHVKIEVGIQW